MVRDSLASEAAGMNALEDENDEPCRFIGSSDVFPSTFGHQIDHPGDFAIGPDRHLT